MACGVSLAADPEDGKIGPGDCGTWRVRILQATNNPGGTRYLVGIDLNASNCNVGPGGETGTFHFDLRSSEQGAEPLRITISYKITNVQ